MDLNNRIKSFYEGNKRNVIVVSSVGLALLIGVVSIFSGEQVDYRKKSQNEVEKVSLTSTSFDDIGILGIKAEIRDLNKSLKEINSQKMADERKSMQRERKLLEDIANLKKSIAKQDDDSRKLKKEQKVAEDKQKKEIAALKKEVKNKTSLVVNSPSEYMNYIAPNTPAKQHSNNVDSDGLPMWESMDEENEDKKGEGIVAKVSSIFSSHDEEESLIFDITEDDERPNFDLVNYEDDNQEDIAVEEVEEVEEITSVYLPTGSIISGTLITGGDFPTAIAYKNDPYPILLRVKAEAILPNFASSDIKECFIVGEGHGVLASERAMLRANTISCVGEDGGAVEASIQAYATGNDGKVGIRGRLVSKQGAVIGKAMLAGFISGVSTAFTPLGLANSVSGAVDVADGVVNPGNIGKTGAISGAQSAMDKLSEHYIKMADEIFPIIEIDAGIQIEFILKKGASLQLVN